MAKIILSDIAQNGVSCATRRKFKMNKKYNEIMKETDRKIEEDYVRYAATYKKASTYMTR